MEPCWILCEGDGSLFYCVYWHCVRSCIFGLIYALMLYSIFYTLIDYLIDKIGIHDFTVYDYTLFGMMLQLNGHDSNSMLLRAVIVAVVYIILFNIGSILLIKKRDVR